MERRVCKICGIEKDISEFFKKEDHYRNICKKCYRQYRRQYYEQNKEKIIQYKKQYREQNKEKIALRRKQYCEQITEGYIAYGLLKMSVSELRLYPPEFIEAKRLQIQIQRSSKV
jgi:hypothetical protein